MVAGGALIITGRLATTGKTGVKVLRFSKYVI